MPTFRKYVFQCTDTNGNFLYDMPVTFPTFTPEEYNAILNTYNNQYSSGSKTVITGGSVSTPGSVTDYGNFILNTVGMKYYSAPYITPVDAAYNKTWFDYVKPYFQGLYDGSEMLNSTPITSTTSMWIYRKILMTNAHGSVETQWATYASNSDRYRPQFLGMNSSNGFKGSDYGSGTGGNRENEMTWSITCYYLVTDGRIGAMDLSGYYNYSSSGISGKFGTANANPSSNDWFPALIKNNNDYEETDPTNTDPYNPGGGSGTGGGSGDFDGTSENINIPDLPTLSAVDTGLISLFNPSVGELKSLANYLWGDVFDISTWKKILADPMDAILGLSIVPVNVPSFGSAPITIGNISTGLSMTKASSQYVSVDCGTINVNEYWGAYLDYSPYTQAEIYLPFIGIHPLTIDDIMGKPVHVVYHIDVLSGACCAYVQCGGSVLYSFVGQCSCSIPITSNDWTNVINGALSIAGAIGSMVASGGATAPMSAMGMASTAVNSLKPTVEKSGSMGGMGGMLGVKKPYIILTRPRQAVPARQNTFTGYPSFITKKLSECSGYTEVESIHLENVPATDGELKEINDLLKSGVII